MHALADLKGALRQFVQGAPDGLMGLGRGVGPAHLAEDLLLAELQNLAASLGECWIEAVELAVSLPHAAPSADAGPLTELERLMHEDVVISHAYREELRETLSDLLRQLPKEARSLLAPDEASEEALLSELALQGSDAVLARLGGESERA